MCGKDFHPFYLIKPINLGCAYTESIVCYQKVRLSSQDYKNLQNFLIERRCRFFPISRTCGAASGPGQLRPGGVDDSGQRFSTFTPGALKR
jgi:hypothetical protein